MYRSNSNPHPWNVTPAQARQIQVEWSKKVITQDELRKVRFVAGVDVGFKKDETRAAVVVLCFPELELYEVATAPQHTVFPYIPGLLSFREAPAILEALKKLKQLPDLLLCDGQGIAHPRRLGIASHIGVLTGLPTIGVAKKRLIGMHETILDKKGKWVPLSTMEKKSSERYFARARE